MTLPFRRYRLESSHPAIQAYNAACDAEAEHEVRVRQAKLVEHAEGAAGTIITYLDLPA